MQRREFLITTAATAAGTLLMPGFIDAAAPKTRRLLYIAEPGIRNYVRYGGIGVLVYDIDQDYTFVKRIPTWELVEGKEPENVKGVTASAKTSKLYVSTIKRIGCWDLVSEKKVWE